MAAIPVEPDPRQWDARLLARISGSSGTAKRGGPVSIALSVAHPLLLAIAVATTGAPFLATLGISCAVLIVLRFAYARAKRMRAERAQAGSAVEQFVNPFGH
jgi:hypothetical protein